MNVLRPCFYIFMLFFILIPAQNSLAQVTVDVGGYGQFWLTMNEHTETASGDSRDVSGYRLRRGRLFARSRINETFGAAVWLDFAGTDRHLLDFYFDVHLKPWLNIRAGQFIMPAQTHDTARLVSSRLIFYERAPVTTQLSSAMGLDAFRDIGIMLYGTYGPLWYGVQASNGTGRFAQAGTSISERSIGDGMYGVRVDYELTDGLFLGGHASINNQKNISISNNEPKDINRKSYSLRLMTDGFGVDRLFSEIEYAAGERDDDQVFTFNGFYTQLGYKVTNNLHLMMRYDQFIRNPDSGIRFKSDSFTLGTLYYIRHEKSEVARVGINYRTGKVNPESLDNYTLMAWLQVRFMP